MPFDLLRGGAAAPNHAIDRRRFVASHFAIAHGTLLAATVIATLGE